MKKMKKLKICIASGLAFVSMLGGIFVGTRNTLAENASEEIKASSLWEPVDGITLEDNVDVPDYMKYGRYAKSFKGEPNFLNITSDAEQNLEPWELNGVKMTSTMDNQSISYKLTLDLNGFTSVDDLLTFAPIPTVRSAQDYTEIEVMLQFLKALQDGALQRKALLQDQGEEPQDRRLQLSECPYRLQLHR